MEMETILMANVWVSNITFTKNEEYVTSAKINYDIFENTILILFSRS